MNRNRKLDDNIDVLGDVHLGKKFINNVPLHRRGEREEMVWEDFENSLFQTKAGLHVQVGDIFDTYVVPIEVVLRAAQIYKNAAEYNPRTQYFIYCGNHDKSRTEGKKSSFDLLKLLLADIENLRVYDTVTPYYNGPGTALAFIPWHPFKSAAELAKELTSLKNASFDYVFGHWDCSVFGGNEHNLIPLEQLKGYTKHIVTGHEHNAREFVSGDINVTVTGSMQPYSHGEDKDGEYYITVHADYMFGLDEAKNKNVRFLLREGETVPDIDALSVTWKMEGESLEDEPDLDVGFEAFDMRALLQASMNETGLDRKYQGFVVEQFDQLGVE